MAKRYFEFFDGEYYHIFNRGANKISIFKSKGDLYYFFDRLNDLNTVDSLYGERKRNIKKYKEIQKKSKKLVSIIAYCLLPNHFHLILKQETEDGISKFMHKMGTSYTKFFNKKYERTGVLFQGKFKATYLKKDDALDLTSVYVNLNYKHHKINPLRGLVKTSLFEYLETEKGEYICNKGEIKKIIGTVSNYKKYLKRQGEYFFERKGYSTKNIDFNELEEEF